MNKVVNIELSSVQMTIDQCGMHILLLDDSGDVVMISPALAEVLYSNSGISFLPGSKPLDAILKNDHAMPAAWVEPMRIGLSGGDIATVMSFTKERMEYYWEIRFSPFINSDGSKGIVALTRDVTRQRRAEKKLVDQNKELKKINSELDRFIYSASHDMRSPITSLRGLINLIRLEDSREDLPVYLSLMEESIGRLDRYIAAITDYSSNTRYDVFEAYPIDFKSLMSSVVDKLSGLSDFNKVRIDIKVQSLHSFSSDPGRIASIVLNIATNGLVFHDARKKPYLKIRVETEPGKAIISFHDNGVGIAPEHIERVSQMFYRGSAMSKGSGLGLYLAKETIERLHGTLRIESQVNVGTTLVVELPNLA